MGVFFKERARARCEELHCKWCAAKRTKSGMFKVRDGPVDWYFCNVVHAEAWLEYRHRAETYELCRLSPAAKIQYLGCTTMGDKISELLNEE